METDLKVYTPTEIQDAPFPDGTGAPVVDSTQQSAGGNFTPQTTKEASFPDPRVAVELIGQALNTRSKRILDTFQFTPSGALQIGDYTQGESGDIRISPNGIVARNKLGDITFSLDGLLGDAVFAGLIQAGTVVGGKVIVGNNTWVIDGDANAPRILLYEDNTPVILIGEGN